LRGNEKCGGRKGCALQFSRGPKVVSDEKQYEAVAAKHVDGRLPVHEREREAGNGSGQECDVGDENDSFMGLRIPTLSKREIHQGCEGTHAHQRYRVEGQLISSGETGRSGQ
jgi:hypothetical protein